MYTSKVTYPNLPSPTNPNLSYRNYSTLPSHTLLTFQPLPILGTQAGRMALDRVCCLSSEFAKMQWGHNSEIVEML